MGITLILAGKKISKDADTKELETKAFVFGSDTKNVNRICTDLNVIL